MATETERTLLHTDTYNASKAIVMVGPEVPASAPVETAPVTDSPEESAEEVPSTESSVVEGIHGGPGVSSEEKASSAGEGGPGEASTPAPAAGPGETEAPVPAAGSGETEAPAQ